MRTILSLLVFFAVALPAFGAGRFGPEWTFTNRRLITATQYERDTGKVEEDVLKLWKRKIARACPSCRYKSNGQIWITDDFWFQLTTDPFVFEVKARPITRERFAQLEDKIQKVVFDTAEDAGLTVHNRLVGGHIHLDKSEHFRGNELLMRNFIVDMFNYPELFMGVLSHDYMNAPPVGVMKSQARWHLKRIINKFDRKEITFDEFIQEIVSKVYNNSGTIQDSSKYQALNLNHDKTFEIRGFQPQKSAKHYLDMITLIESRIAYLKTFDEPIPYINKDFAGKYSYAEVHSLHQYKTKLDAKIIVAAYREFVEQSGLDWDDYKHYYADPRLREDLLRSRPIEPRCQNRLKRKVA